MKVEIEIDNGFTMFLGYLAAGMVVYFLTDGSELAWSNPWLLICLAGWPLVAGFYVLQFALILMVAIISVVAMILAKMWVDERLAERRLRRAIGRL